ncbi:hypothetical protein ACOBQB_09925 [Streptomyces sp. G5(2025)]|uniref:hypothetical protein n=1 Tax=Streptomyces sp. G5(2025) TaxID=3406628 RepID=UPI003C23C07A
MAGADSAYASVDLVVVVEIDFGGGVRLSQVQYAGLVRGGFGAEHGLEGLRSGGSQLVQRLVRPEIENDAGAVCEGAADGDGEGGDCLHLPRQFGGQGLPFGCGDLGGRLGAQLVERDVEPLVPDVRERVVLGRGANTLL